MNTATVTHTELLGQPSLDEATIIANPDVANLTDDATALRNGSTIDLTLDEVFELDIAAPHGAEHIESASTAEPDVDPFWVYVSSILASTAFFFLAVGLPCWYAFNLSWGAAVGGLTAAWAGPGFGVMIGGARMVAIGERRDREHDQSGAGTIALVGRRTQVVGSSPGAGARSATVIDRAQRPLSGFDPDLLDLLVERSSDGGLDLQRETTVSSMESV